MRSHCAPPLRSATLHSAERPLWVQAVCFLHGLGHQCQFFHVSMGGGFRRKQPWWLTPKAIRLNRLARFA
jgi:hypothetical protein